MFVCHRTNPFAKCDKCEHDQKPCSLNVPTEKRQPIVKAKRIQSRSSTKSRRGRRMTESDRGREDLSEGFDPSPSVAAGMSYDNYLIKNFS